MLDLLANAIRFGRGQIDFVDHRNDFQVVVQRQIGVGERLRFHSLRGVYYQQSPFARLQAARDFVAEIDVAGSIDQVELILLAVGGPVSQPHGVSFNRNAPFALQIHGIEHLRHHLAFRQRAGGLQQPVGERRLPVIYVRNNAEIADVRWVHYAMMGPEAGRLRR